MLGVNPGHTIHLPLVRWHVFAVIAALGVLDSSLYDDTKNCVFLLGHFIHDLRDLLAFFHLRCSRAGFSLIVHGVSGLDCKTKVQRVGVLLLKRAEISKY